MACWQSSFTHRWWALVAADSAMVHSDWWGDPIWCQRSMDAQPWFSLHSQQPPRPEETLFFFIFVLASCTCFLLAWPVHTLKMRDRDQMRRAEERDRKREGERCEEDLRGAGRQAFFTSPSCILEERVNHPQGPWRAYWMELVQKGALPTVRSQFIWTVMLWNCGHIPRLTVIKRQYKEPSDTNKAMGPASTTETVLCLILIIFKLRLYQNIHPMFWVHKDFMVKG